jgi:TRAP-type uncharacterized transport system substrate-binding protein
MRHSSCPTPQGFGHGTGAQYAGEAWLCCPELWRRGAEPAREKSSHSLEAAGMRLHKHFAWAQFILGFVMLTANPAEAQKAARSSPSAAASNTQGGNRPSAQENGNASALVDRRLPNRDTLNNSTVTILTAPVDDAFAAMGADMANVLDDGDNLHVLPVIGKGSVQNLIDMMRLKDIDMGFVVSDAFEFVKTEYAVPNMESRVQYIAKLFHNDVHIVARKEIGNIHQLEGKKVLAELNLGYVSIRNLFRRLNIMAEVDLKTEATAGLKKMLNGEADAWIISAAKVAPIIRNIKNDAGEFHLVSVPYDKAIGDDYLPSSFTNAEYPNLVVPGEAVETIATSTLLMVNNWPAGSKRYIRVAKFVDALFSKMGLLQEPIRHPKWRETFIGAAVPGLRRFKAAEEWLIQHKASTAVELPDRRLFEQFLNQNRVDAVPNNADQKDALFRQFNEWLKTPAVTTTRQ